MVCEAYPLFSVCEKEDGYSTILQFFKDCKGEPRRLQLGGHSPQRPGTSKSPETPISRN